MCYSLEMNRKRRLRILIGVLLFICVLAGATLRSIMAASKYEFLQAYSHSPFLSSAFLAEREQLLKSWVYHEDGSITSADFSGAYYHVSNNRRLTPHQPSSAKHTLWLLGSSTLYDFEVPDDYTIAANLQRMLPDYRVENLAEPGIDTERAIAILAKTDIRPGDIVVVYDGMNELAPVIKSADKLPTAKRVYQRYRQAVIAGHAYALSHGAAWHHFMPPTIYSLHNDFERWLFADSRFPFPTANKDYAIFWPMLLATPFSVDLSHILDSERDAGAEFFFDGGHMNDQADTIIARAIVDAIAPTF